MESGVEKERGMMNHGGEMKDARRPGGQEARRPGLDQKHSSGLLTFLPIHPSSEETHFAHEKLCFLF